MTTTFAPFTETPHIDRGNEQLVLTTPSLYDIIFNVVNFRITWTLCTGERKIRAITPVGAVCNRTA